MVLPRLRGVSEISSEDQRVYAAVRAGLDSPFLPSLFQQLAGAPDYLRAMWRDLEAVVQSREFQAAVKALEEFSQSLMSSGGWSFSDPQRVLSRQKFSAADIAHLGGIAATLARVSVRMALFARLMRTGLFGGQGGRLSPGRQASVLARLITLHVPGEDDAGWRTGLIFSDIKRTLDTRHVPVMYRVLSPFPPYLASVWLDSKKMLADASFAHAYEQVAQRASGLLARHTGQRPPRRRAHGATTVERDRSCRRHLCPPSAPVRAADDRLAAFSFRSGKNRGLSRPDRSIHTIPEASADGVLPADAGAGGRPIVPRRDRR